MTGGGTLKMKPLTPFKFYGEEAPRKISKDPKQVMEPLLEWAKKAHWKQGGLAGHGGKGQGEDPVPKAPRAAREFFFEERIKQLDMHPTRDELSAMKQDLIRSWQELPLEKRGKFEDLHAKDVERFEEEMETYKERNPEYEAKSNERLQERKRAAAERNFRKSKKLRRDAKVIYSEDEWSDGNSDSDIENMPKRLQSTPKKKLGTPRKGRGYTDAYEFPLSPRSIRRNRREAAKRAL